MSLYHRDGLGRKPYNPVSMLKAQLLKYLLRVPSDRRLALLLKKNRKMARACGFSRKTPSHGLFTQFRHRLGKDVKGEIVAVDSTAVKRTAKETWKTRGERATLTPGLEEAEEDCSRRSVRLSKG